MEDTESPNKRLKLSAQEEEEADFVSFNDIDNDDNQYGYNTSPPLAALPNQGISNAPREPHSRNASRQPHRRDFRNDPRHAKDRPKSKHILPNHEPWILVRTKYGRRFVHNTQTGLSLWRIPQDVFEGVRELEREEGLGREKAENAKWAEEQLREMRRDMKEDSGKADGGKGSVGASGTGEAERSRRRRSESLQREDEEALMAELAAEAEKAEEKDVKEVVDKVNALQPSIVKEDGYASDSSYEEVEVTDSEFEDYDEGGATRAASGGVHDTNNGEHQQQQADDHVEFGEDDIAYQLAAMEQEEGGDDADLEAEQLAALEGMGHENDETWPSDAAAEDEEDGDGMSEEDATAHFHAMLTSHSISPFTPWENIISNETLLYDDRWTFLSSTRARKAAWEVWVKDAAAKRAEERKKLDLLDPKVPYLAFLSEKATPKLYWPEFKRKYRKEAVMGERRLRDKEREKLYRDFISRQKLPESSRKADLKTLLEALPLRVLNRDTKTDALPQEVLGHLHYASLPPALRDPVVEMHVAVLAPALVEGEEGEIDAEVQAKKDKGNEKRANAIREREKKVEQDRRKAEKEERWAKGLAKEAEREVRDAMKVGNMGLRGHL